MKAMACKMCNGNDFVKENDMYVCQFCGTKYSIESAQKLYIEGPVKIDYSEEVKNLYELARMARNANDGVNAQKYYELILFKEPSSWEANFYSVYYQAVDCTGAEIKNAANRLINTTRTVLHLISNNISDDNKKVNIIKEIGENLIAGTIKLYRYSTATYGQILIDNGRAVVDILYKYGDNVIEMLGEEGLKFAVPCWKVSVNIHAAIFPIQKDRNRNKKIINYYSEKIKNYKGSYAIKVNESNNERIKKCKGSYAIQTNERNNNKNRSYNGNRQRKGCIKGVSIFLAIFLVLCIIGMVTGTIEKDKNEDLYVKDGEITENRGEDLTQKTLKDIEDWYENQTIAVSQNLIEYSTSVTGLSYLNVNDSKFRFGEDSGWYDCHYWFAFTCTVDGINYKGEARAFMKYNESDINWFHFEIFANDGIQSLVEHYDESYDTIIEDYYKELERLYQ